MYHMTEELALNAIYGGWLLGGGGGGTLAGGKGVVRVAMANGGFDVCTIDELTPETLVVTGSLVGSPSSGGDDPSGASCVHAYELFRKNTGCTIGALISNESGAHSITNGWIAAAVNHLPVIDAACNGRAHPTGIMGAMSLHRKDGYQTVQAAAGGTGEQELNLFTSGTIASTSQMVRTASTMTGGMISVLRNPIDADYVRENAAIGTLSMCIEVGKTIRECENKPEAMAENLGKQIGLQVLAQGKLHDFKLECKGGFDVGSAVIGDGYEVTFWNEYMTAEKDGERLATFPDLIHLLDSKSGLPICSAALSDGMDVMLVNVPREKLLLGSTMFDKKLFEACEQAIEKPIIPFVFK